MQSSPALHRPPPLIGHSPVATPQQPFSQHVSRRHCANPAVGRVDQAFIEAGEVGTISEPLSAELVVEFFPVHDLISVPLCPNRRMFGASRHLNTDTAVALDDGMVRGNAN